MPDTSPRSLNISLPPTAREMYKTALQGLAEELGLATISDLVRHIADLYLAARPETIAALTIAHECAMGGDWDKLIDFIFPDYGRPPEDAAIEEEN